MKRYIVLFVLVALFAGNSLAAENVSKDRLELAEKAYKLALKSDNAGVRNSALHRIAVLKSRTPEFETNEYKSILKSMANKDDKAYIRVNAKITLDLLNNKNLIENVDTETVDPNEFFNSIHMKMVDLYAIN